MNPQPGRSFSSLYDDIVLYIFDFNTDLTQPSRRARKGYKNIDDVCLTEEDPEPDFAFLLSKSGYRTRFHALTITLRTSQVCRRWRQLLHGTTAIWGRLLDLDILSNVDLQLMTEVFRRAGSGSRLSVKGSNIYFPHPSCDLVFDLIRDHWDRLEWVDLSIETHVQLSGDQTRFWSTITTPAPYLRHFNFTFSIPITPNSQTLTENAPALRELYSSPSSPLHLDSPWLHQLTLLSIDGASKPEIPFTLPEFLNVLSHMPNIETLRLVSSRVAERDYNRYQNIELPGLRKLILDDDFNTCFSVLRRLAPSSQCTLDIRAKHPHDIPPEHFWRIPLILERYLAQRPYNDRIVVDLQPNYVSFVDGYPDCYPTPTVSIHIEYDPEHDDEYAQSFLSILPKDRFKAVKDFWFRVNLPALEEYPLTVYENFHYCLESAQVLKTTTQSFMLLATASSSIDDGKIPVPLPQLERVRILSNSDEDEYYDDLRELGPEFVQQFLHLFERRKRRDKPIQHLDVRQCEGDLRELDRCDGLKVTWLNAEYRNEGSGEYICGSGNPEILQDVGDY